MSAVAIIAESRDHQSEWLNVYGRVEIILTTHDARGLLERDVKLAERIDELALLFGAARTDGQPTFHDSLDRSGSGLAGSQTAPWRRNRASATALFSLNRLVSTTSRSPAVTRSFSA